MLRSLRCTANLKTCSDLVQKRFIYKNRPTVNTSQLKSGRRTGGLAMKVGMVPIWDKWGEKHAATVLQLDNCQVVQTKTVADHGYTALQLGVGEAKVKNVNKAKRGHYEKYNLVPNRKLWEFRVTPDAILPPGTKIHADHFLAGQRVDVCGKSKGKGFQGVMKRWGFRGGFASHGASVSHRVPGSTGCRQDPGRVFPGKKMPGRKGNKRVTKQNLLVLKVDPSRELIYVKGNVPGANGGWVRISDAVKGPFFPSPPPFPTLFDDGKTERKVSFAPVPEKDTLDLPVPDEQA